MTCRLEHKRSVGDTLSKWAVQLTRGGVPPNLTGKVVKFVMYDSLGNVKVPESEDNIVVTDAALAYLDYDWQAAGVDTAGVYKGYFTVWDGAETEPDTYPEHEDGIEITIFAKNEPVIEEEETIDILAAANAPKRTRTVEGTVEERTIHELIAADRYQNSKDAAAAVPWGMRIAKTKPPSTLS